MLSDISDLNCVLMNILVCNLNNTKIYSVKYDTRYSCQNPFLPSSPNCSVAEVFIGMYQLRITLLTRFESLDDGSQDLIVLCWKHWSQCFGKSSAREEEYGHQQLNNISMPNLLIVFFFFFVSKKALTSSEVKQHGTISVVKVKKNG